MSFIIVTGPLEYHQYHSNISTDVTVISLLLISVSFTNIYHFMSYQYYKFKTTQLHSFNISLKKIQSKCKMSSPHGGGCIYSYLLIKLQLNLNAVQIFVCDSLLSSLIQSKKNLLVIVEFSLPILEGSQLIKVFQFSRLHRLCRSCLIGLFSMCMDRLIYDPTSSTLTLEGAREDIIFKIKQSEIDFNQLMQKIQIQVLI